MNTSNTSNTTASIEAGKNKATAEMMAKLAIEVMLPKGMFLDIIWRGNQPALSFRVRYMHNGVRKSLGTFSSYPDAMQRLAAERAKEVLDTMPANWRDVIEQSIETLVALREPEDLKTLALAKHFGADDKSEFAEAARSIQEELYEMVGWIAPHELQRGKSATYTDEDSGEITTIPANIVNRYLDDMDAKLMKMKFAPSGDDFPDVGESNKQI